MRPRRPRAGSNSQEEPTRLVPTPTAADAAPQPPTTPRVVRRHLTREARALLRQADEGGVPMFVSQNLRRIANENGIDVTDAMTPNDIVEALRARAAGSNPPRQDADGSHP